MSSFGFTIELRQNVANIFERAWMLDDNGNATTPYRDDGYGNIDYFPHAMSTTIGVDKLKAELVIDENTGESALNLYEIGKREDEIICTFTRGLYPSGVSNTLDGHDDPSDIYNYLMQYMMSV